LLSLTILMSKLHDRYNKSQCISDSMWTRSTGLGKSSDISIRAYCFSNIAYRKNGYTLMYSTTPDTLDDLQDSLSQISHHESTPPSDTLF